MTLTLLQSANDMHDMHDMQFNLWLSLQVWISDTLSQGYTILQSLVKCLYHTDIALHTVCSQARLRNSSEAIVPVMES